MRRHLTGSRLDSRSAGTKLMRADAACNSEVNRKGDSSNIAASARFHYIIQRASGLASPSSLRQTNRSWPPQVLLLALTAPAMLTTPVTLLVIVIVLVHLSSWGRLTGKAHIHNGLQAAADGPGALEGLEPVRSESLYKCELSYFQMDSSLIKFSVEHLIIENIESENNDNNNRKSKNHSDNNDDDKGRHAQNRAADTDEGPPTQRVTLRGDNFRLEEIDLNASAGELHRRSKLDPNLPFVVFVNGFNTLNEYGEINGTWMFDVANNLAKDSMIRAQSIQMEEEEEDRRRRAQERRSSSRLLLVHQLLSSFWLPERREQERLDVNTNRAAPLSANVLFLTWGIPELATHNVLAMIPAYYKTVANYDSILSFVSRSITQMVEFVEWNNKRDEPRWSSAQERAEFYLKFKFYGHSLGSHILADAMQRARQALSVQAESSSVESARATNASLTAPKFGRLIGLDPATPCFLSLEHGISAKKVARAIDELLVVHSNAGLAGLTSERADIEIVLNGGTFQPGCAWYEFGCHHSRSTDILRYRDDECQMVAYKCTSYHHFKRGACETCEDTRLDGASLRWLHAGDVDSGCETMGSSGGAHDCERDSQEAGLSNMGQVRNCVLVNMPEQHIDDARMLEYAIDSDRVRQLASDEETGQEAASANVSTRNNSSGRPRSNAVNESDTHATSGSVSERARKSFYHYVNTSPNFRAGRKSHCLEHYQLRLIIYHENGDDKRIERQCPPSAYYMERAHGGGGGGGGSGRGTSHIEPRIKLLYEPDPIRAHSKRLPSGARTSAKFSGSIGLSAIIKDMLHTALLTFERAPRLFVGALLDNLNVEALADCYKRANATSGPKFVLDIAFMSHINAKVRHAFSSVLCGRLELTSSQSIDSPASVNVSGTVQQEQRGRESASLASSNARERTIAPTIGPAALEGDALISDDDHEDDGGVDKYYSRRAPFVLSLCRQSELNNVNGQIDKLLEQIKLQRLDETWKVSLLNNLFSLFAEWEPF